MKVSSSPQTFLSGLTKKEKTRFRTPPLTEPKYYYLIFAIKDKRKTLKLNQAQLDCKGTVQSYSVAIISELLTIPMFKKKQQKQKVLKRKGLKKMKGKY